MAEFDQDLWMFEVESVSKISPDPKEVVEDVIYAIVFNANGRNASAEIEVFVDDVTDPAQIIILAMSHLHVALAAWARLKAGRRIANDDDAG